MKKVISLAVISAVAFTTLAETRPFNYNFNGEEPTGYRKTKTNPEHDTETIDVAIFIDGTLAGKKITSISVPVTGNVSSLSGFGAFLTTKLATKTVKGEKVNNPDICAIDATLVDGVLTATFPEPYTITADGVYVGYSMTDASFKAKPVAVVEGYVEDALWYRGSDANPKWIEIGKTIDKSSDLTVYLEGEFAPVAVKLSDLDDIYSAIAESGSVEAGLIGFCTEPVKSISYTATVAGVSKSYDLDFSTEIPAKLGYPFTAILEVPAVDALGEYPLTVVIDKVNGILNTAADNSEVSDAKVLSFVPKNNPLVEGYTGLGCGWCPGEYVTLRQMHDRYGVENFVAVSYHNMLESGCMVCLDKFPYNPSGIPYAKINRCVSPAVLDIPVVWAKERKKLAPGEVEVTLEWADVARTELTAKARARFLEDDEDSPYLLSFCVVADGLSNPKWAQSNSYENYEPTGRFAGDYWDLFVGAGSPVMGLVFDDIAVHYPDQTGVKGSLPTQIKGGEWYEATFSFKPGDLVNVEGEHIINDFNKLRVIAIINDVKDKNVMNSASSLYPDGTGNVEDLSGVMPEAAPVYYNLSGIHVKNPSNGIFIKVEDGKASKVRF